MDIPHVDGYEFDVKIGGGSFSTVYKVYKKVRILKCIIFHLKYLN